MTRVLLALCCALGLLATAPAAHATRKAAQRQAPAPLRDGQAEARLIEIYRLIGQAQTRQALARAEALVAEHPNFQLAQLVLGDLLLARQQPVRAFGDVPEPVARAGGQTLTELREESLQRLRALRERPPEGALPAQFVQLSPRNRHAIAIDTARSRLYLFQNGPQGPRLIADYYVSVGKSGIEKSVEGDLRTPLGAYFITANLDPKTLRDFYGSGALPINYPNPYDVRRGKTGSGIWLHGTPPNQFSRAPKATDGCVVLANPDLERILRMVEVRTTPVVIAHSLRWVNPAAADPEHQRFAAALQGWRAAKSEGDLGRLLGFYTPDFSAAGKPLAEWTPLLRVELSRARGRAIELKDLSILRWTDSADTMVVTFGEVAEGSRTGPTRRQYWMRDGGQWKIFYEGVIG